MRTINKHALQQSIKNKQKALSNNEKINKDETSRISK